MELVSLTHTCLFCNKVKDLADFYGSILNVQPTNYGDAYAELVTSGATLSLFSIASQNELMPETAQAGSNKSMILEFQVADVDEEYERLKNMGVHMVKDLTTQEWGNRSFYFRDPEGNLINFYSRVKV